MDSVLQIILLLCIFSVGNGIVFRQGRFKHHGLVPPPKNDYQGQLPPDLWFKQKLDHFNPQDTRTWQQVSESINLILNLELEVERIYTTRSLN